MGDKRLEEFFRDPRRIGTRRAQERSGRLITTADLAGEHKFQQGEIEDSSLVHQMVKLEGQHLSAVSRAKRMPERMNTEADAVTRAAKANDVETESRRRAKRDRDFWVDGLVGEYPD